jgi:hypothetical protein
MRAIEGSLRGRRRGSALLASLAVVIGVGALTAVSLQLQTSRLSRLQTENDKKRAFYLAEAVLAEAVLSLQHDGSGNIASEAAPAAFGDGFVFAETTEDEAGLLHVDAYGIQGRARQRLTRVLEKEFKPLSREGFYGRETLIVNPGTQAFTDTRAYRLYRQSVRAAKDAADGTNLIVAADGLPNLRNDVRPRLSSDGQIALLGGVGPLFTSLDVDVRPGPNAVLVLPVGTSVAGVTAPRAEPAPLPRIRPPKLPGAPDLLLRRLQTDSLQNSSRLLRISVPSTAILNLTGPLTLVVDEWTQGGTVNVNSTNGPVDLYVMQRFTLDSGARFNNPSGQASSLRIQVSAEDLAPLVIDRVRWNSNLPFIGQLYAPKANVRLPDRIHFKGALAAGTLQVGSRALLEHDPMLAVNGIGTNSFTDRSWRVLPVPPELADPVAYDPARQYQQLAIEPLLPAFSHRAVEQVVRFTQAETGRLVTYRGNLGDVAPRRIAAVIDTVSSNDARFPAVRRPGGAIDDDIDDDVDIDVID